MYCAEKRLRRKRSRSKATNLKYQNSERLSGRLITMRVAWLVAWIFCCQLCSASAEPILRQELPERSSNSDLSRLTLPEAVRLALRNYPEIKALKAHAEAQRGKIRKAETNYLPRGSMVIQELRATSNNISGPLFPQMTIPMISGPVNGRSNNMEGGWGSAAGMLLSWEPFDFGFRKASVGYAESVTRQAESKVLLRKLEVQAQAADSFLAVVAAEQTLVAIRAKLERMKIFAKTVQVLAQRELRPQTDSFLAEAELASTRDEVIEAEQNVELALASFARSVGVKGDSIRVDSNPLVRETPKQRVTPPSGDLSDHPAAAAQSASVAVASAHKKVLDKSYYPRFDLLSSVYGRGSSFAAADVRINESRGYFPEKVNYAVGVSVTFPFLDIFKIQADKQIASQLEQEQKARYSQVLLDLDTQDRRSRAMIKAAIRLAENAPIKVSAAREASRSTKIRYKHGLATVNDVAQDEELLTKSEVSFAIARLRVWRALLAAAVAGGDLNPFMQAASRVYSGRR